MQTCHVSKNMSLIVKRDIFSSFRCIYCKNILIVHSCSVVHSFGERAISAPPFGRGIFGAGQLGAVPFRRRTFGRHFIIYFSSYEEKIMKQAIP